MRKSKYKKTIEVKRSMALLKSKPTLILADDHDGVLRRVKELLANEFNVVAALSKGTDIANATLKYKPDILVLDISMPGLNGIQAGREIRRLGISAKLIFLTVQEDPDYVQAARGLQASYVLKRRMLVDLPLAIQEALAGRIFVSPLPVLPASPSV
jgi:DNA-binding NarL/FixJ family response regulator